MTVSRKARAPERILGIDPGSLNLGWGCIERQGSQLVHIAHGTVKLKSEQRFSYRLFQIDRALKEVIRKYQPTVLALEKAFFSKNASSALKLGQVRGVVMLCGEVHQLDFFEYSPNEVKRSISGHGHSDKTGMEQMLHLILGKKTYQTHDESDAVSIAICHALSLSSSKQGRLQQGGQQKRKISDLYSP